MCCANKLLIKNCLNNMQIPDLRMYNTHDIHAWHVGNNWFIYIFLIKMKKAKKIL